MRPDFPFPRQLDKNRGIFEVAAILAYRHKSNQRMQRINLDGIYKLGKDLSVLGAIRPGLSAARMWDIAILAIGTLGMLRRNSDLKLSVCTPAIDELWEQLDKFIEWDAQGYPIPTPPDAVPVTKWQAEALSEAYAKFEAIFCAEILRVHSYLLPQVGVYSTDSLVEHAEELFDEPIRILLSEMTVNDLREAGKSLACALYTATAFHLFRAIEGVMQDYVTLYHGSLGNESDRNWGKYIDWLVAANATKLVTDKLTRLRKEHRNPTMHPAMVILKQEAMSLLVDTQVAIQLMIADMERKKDPNSALAQMLP